MSSVTIQSKQKRKWPLWLMLILSGCLLVGIVWGVYDWLTFNPAGEIAYECLGDQVAKFHTVLNAICVVNADGSDQRVVSPPELISFNSPTWSPDGEQLAFIGLRVKDRHYEIYRLNMKDKTISTMWAAQETVPTILESIVWSPNGKQLLINASINNTAGLFVLDVDGQSPQSLLSATIYRNDYVFSHDGLYIYFIESTRPDPKLSQYVDKMWRMSSDTKVRETLEPICWDAALSPIANTFICDANGGFVFQNLDSWPNRSSVIKNWAIMVSGFRNPAWSPDGKYIVYSQTYWPGFMGDNNGELWVMRADGSHPVKLTNGPADRNPAWRPEP